MIIIKKDKNVRLVELYYRIAPVYQVQKRNWLGQWKPIKDTRSFCGDLHWFISKNIANDLYERTVGSITNMAQK